MSDPQPHDRRDIAALLGIMAALRDPAGGCPWDLQQDFASIAPYTIEEAYEVADAIDRGELGELKDELGDLLLQVVFHARMAEEAGAFASATWSRRSATRWCAGIHMCSMHRAARSIRTRGRRRWRMPNSRPARGRR